jgi:hypothetical protein
LSVDRNPRPARPGDIRFGHGWLYDRHVRTVTPEQLPLCRRGSARVDAHGRIWCLDPAKTQVLSSDDGHHWNNHALSTTYLTRCDGGRPAPNSPSPATPWRSGYGGPTSPPTEASPGTTYRCRTAGWEPIKLMTTPRTAPGSRAPARRQAGHRLLQDAHRRRLIEHELPRARASRPHQLHLRPRGSAPSDPLPALRPSACLLRRRRHLASGAPRSSTPPPASHGHPNGHEAPKPRRPARPRSTDIH